MLADTQGQRQRVLGDENLPSGCHLLARHPSLTEESEAVSLVDSADGTGTGIQNPFGGWWDHIF